MTPLETRAQQNDVAAQVELAQSHAARGDHNMARGWLARAAQNGHRPALRLLAESLLLCPPQQPEQGIAMIRQAAEAGDAQALYNCASLAAQDATLHGNWDVAAQYLRRAADAGLETARTEQAIVPGDIGPLLAPRQFEILRDSPRLLVCPNFASPAECDWLIGAARPRIELAQVYDGATGAGVTAHELRDNSSAAFGILQMGLVLSAMRHRLRTSCGFESCILEPPMVLHYAPGQQFAPHFDFMDPQLPGLRQVIATRGQRVATFLLYLNDDFTGGETAFEALGLYHRGRKGDALLFWNVDEQGAPDRRTRHAGVPPQDGEKWVLSQWVRLPPAQERA
jgi:prolyl 4-hydroxylase